MSSTIESIVVVGGGTAGWLSACILAKKLNCKANGKLTITLIDSPDIPSIGVGEGTVPTMRETLKLIGVSESDFIKACDVTFKQSIRFDNWLHNPTKSNAIIHSYHHLFNFPHTPQFDLTPYWLLGTKETNFSDSVSYQGVACDNQLGPKKITNKEYQAPLEYAYHLDAAKFSKFLAEHGTAHLGIKHIQATIDDVQLSADGAIKSVVMGEQHLEGDFFIDCSGFSSTLLGNALNVDFIDKGDQLLVDTALAMQVPYHDHTKEIPPYTIATAQEAGWTWDIGLSERRGVGYVYSSKHTTDEQAEKVLRNYIGDESIGLSARKINMRVGYRERFWQKNCVAIGLSAGFVEPLEATALLIVEASAKLLAEKLPSNSLEMSYAQQSFNKITRYAWDRVIDFIKLHYYLSQRTDSQFWLDTTNKNTVPQSLLEKLEHWKSHAPCPSDFFSKYEVFQLENYQYVLYGMEYSTDIKSIEAQFPYKLQAQQEMDNIAGQAQKIKQQLGSHRELIEKIKAFGLSKI